MVHSFFIVFFVSIASKLTQTVYTNLFLKTILSISLLNFFRHSTDELGMNLPTAETSVRQFCTQLGMQNLVRVLVVSTRTVKNITMEEWCNYFEQEGERGENDLRLSKILLNDTKYGKFFKKLKKNEKM